MSQSAYRILLVEDSDDYALIITRGIHRDRDFQLVWRAKDGVEAIKYLGGMGECADRERFPAPDIMLLDMQLPRKDGWEVLDWLKDQTNKPLVVVLTVLDNTAFHKKAIALGADEFKEKPYVDEALKEFLAWLKEFAATRAQKT
jgi:CheY-like chemotaxis protein